MEGQLPWKSTLTDPDCMTLVAREKGVVLGFITVWLSGANPFGKGKLAEVDLLVVDKRLRHRGIGRFVFESAVDRLSGFNQSHILLNVKTGNVPAMLFWAKLGFKKVSGTEYVRADGVAEGTFYMLRTL
ncbi:MAG: GNAT family N-acetyltransferase [Candidatus Altiarchaeota archaeon]